MFVCASGLALNQPAKLLLFCEICNKRNSEATGSRQFPVNIAAHKTNNPLNINGLFYKTCDPCRIQTCNPHIRSVVLYSVELMDPCPSKESQATPTTCRLRTSLSQKRVQRYCFFLNRANKSAKKWFFLEKVALKGTDSTMKRAATLSGSRHCIYQIKRKDCPIEQSE